MKLSQKNSIPHWSKAPQILHLVVILLLVSLFSAACGSAPAPPATQIVSERINAEEYNQQFDGEVDHLLIDVRTSEEFESGHIPGAINISVQSLPNRLDEVPSDLPLVVYCRSGNRSATATEILVDAGYQPVYDLGGIQDWISAGYPVE